MERELELAKLRRLRCRADYPLRLFLTAMGRLHWVEESGGERVRQARTRGKSGLAPVLAWRSGERGCPYCGRNAAAGRVRRIGVR